jgi:hypothetical protein
MTGRATVLVGLFSIRRAKASVDSQHEITAGAKCWQSLFPRKG